MGSAPRLGESSPIGDIAVHECRICDHALRCWDALTAATAQKPPDAMTWQGPEKSTSVPWREFRATAMRHWTGYGNADELATHLGQPFGEQGRVYVLGIWRERRRCVIEKRTAKDPDAGSRGALFAFYLDRMELDGLEITGDVMRKIGAEVFGNDVPSYIATAARIVDRGNRVSGQEAGDAILRGLGIGRENPARERARQQSLEHDERRERFP